MRNAIQKKSAGSFLLGAYYNMDYAGFLSGASTYFVPDYFPTEVQDTFPLNAYTAMSYGISFGYTYTFVFWKSNIRHRHAEPSGPRAQVPPNKKTQHTVLRCCTFGIFYLGSQRRRHKLGLRN